jgi:hypothetical protein
MAWRAWRHTLPKEVAIPLITVPLLSIALIGYPLFHSLAGQATRIWDPSPSGVIDRFPNGIDEIFTGLLPLLSHYLPWWPLAVVAVIAVIAIPQARHRFAEWWFFWPLLAAPVLFLVAYHFMNPFPFSVRPYRARMAIFFVPAFVLIVAALADVATNAASRWSFRARAAVGVLTAALVLTQLPSMARVLTKNEAPDYEQAANVLTHHLPKDAIVLYDTLNGPGLWRQPFSGKPRYMHGTPFVGQVSKLMQTPGKVPERGRVYVLLLDSECAMSVVCDGAPAAWDGNVPGWRAVRRFDRFTLYRPTEPLTGRQGVITAMTEFGEEIGPNDGYPEILVAASLLKKTGHAAEGRALIEQMYQDTDAETRERIEASIEKRHQNPFD